MIRDVARLLRPRVGLLATAGAFAGSLLHQSPQPGLALTLAGTLALACGCSALNQVQEREADGRMARTRQRPLPAGRLRPATALALAAACLTVAGLLLGLRGKIPALILAGLVLLVYNGIYTPLKKVTTFSMLVGGLAGAMPPVLGFVAEGGVPGDARVLVLAAVFYCWQVPHFWLFAWLHREDYRAAGFRVPDPPGPSGPRRLPFLAWLTSYCAGLLLVPGFCLVASTPAKWFVAALALGLCACAPLILSRRKLGFALVNASLVLLLCGLAADALWLAA